MIKQRLDKVLKIMSEEEIPQMIVSDPSAIFYLTGKWIFPGERMLALYINLNGNNKLFINELFPISEDLGVEKIWFNDTQSPVKILADNIDKESPMGIDKNWPAHFLIKLMQLKGGSSFVNGSEILDRVRMCKDENEKELMRAASKLNDSAMGEMIKLVPDKHSEIKMGKLLGEYMGRNGN